MQSPGKIENVKTKIHAIARKVLYHGIGNFVWASGSGQGEFKGSRKKFSWGERRAKGRVRLLKARGLVEHGKIAFGSAAQGLWLKDRKVGVYRIRLPGRGTVREVRR